MQEINKFDAEIKVIPNELEKYMAFVINIYIYIYIFLIACNS